MTGKRARRPPACALCPALGQRPGRACTSRLPAGHLCAPAPPRSWARPVRPGRFKKQSGLHTNVTSASTTLVTKETSRRQKRERREEEKVNHPSHCEQGGRPALPGPALTDRAGHEVDPRRLHLDVEPVAVRHQQPCGESMRARGGCSPGCGTGRRGRGQCCAPSRQAAVTAASQTAEPPAQDGAVTRPAQGHGTEGARCPAAWSPHPRGSAPTHWPCPTLQGQLGARRAIGAPTGMPSPHTWDQDVPEAQEREGPVTQGQWGRIQPGHLQDHRQLGGEKGAAATRPAPGPAPAARLRRTFSRVAEFVGPVATSTMMLFPL